MAFQLRDRIAAVTILLLTTGGLFHIQDMPAGAAMFPRLVLGLATLLAVAWLISTFVSKRTRTVKPGTDSSEPHPFMENPVNLGVFLVAIAGYIALIDVIGYFTSTVLFMAIAAAALGFRRIKYTGVTIILFVGFVYFIFVGLFDRPLPIEFFQQ